MHHIALVLTTTATVLAGSVWSVPALQTLRAGQDRPHSARLRAAACLAGWGSGLLLAVVLLLVPDVPAAFLALAAGEALAALLGLRGLQTRRRERRAEASLWTELGCTDTPRDHGGLHRAVLAWTLAAAAAGSLSVGLLVTTGRTEPALLLAAGLSSAALAAVGTLTVQHRLGPQVQRGGNA